MGRGGEVKVEESQKRSVIILVEGRRRMGL